MKLWLEKNNKKMHSAYNEGKSVVAERFVRTLKNEIYEYMTSISKNMYIDELGDIVKKYNNTYHRAIKMKSVNVKGDTYINTDKEINDKDPNFSLVIMLEKQNTEIFSCRLYSKLIWRIFCNQ